MPAELPAVVTSCPPRHLRDEEGVIPCRLSCRPSSRRARRATCATRKGSSMPAELPGVVISGPLRHLRDEEGVIHAG